MDKESRTNKRIVKTPKKKLNEMERIIVNNLGLILDGIAGTQTTYQIESGVCFANYLNHVGINSNNYHLFLNLIETNNLWIIDALIGKRDARLLFTTIKPNKYLLKKAFQFLTLWHPKQIYLKVLPAILGIIECGYYKPDDGYKIYRLTINDMNNLGKFLDPEKDQMDDENSVILHILDKIAKIGEYRHTITKSILSKHAFDIRHAYFDNTKKLVDVIPHVLLVNLKREDTEMNPSKEFINFIKSKSD
jgi:hypothetical protein